MSKKTGIIFVILGVVLILLALLLLIHNMYEDEKAGQISEDLLYDIKSEISNNIDDHNSGSDASDEQSSPNGESNITSEGDAMPIVEIEGYDYIGYVTIPSIGVELPVMAEWNYMRLDMAPCRQSGSTVTDDLVIAAHNYKKHFAYLSKTKVGDPVNFTDMNGRVISYTVSEIAVFDGTAVEEVLQSGHDLTLYTCTYEGTTRIVVFCDRA